MHAPIVEESLPVTKPWSSPLPVPFLGATLRLLHPHHSSSVYISARAFGRPVAGLPANELGLDRQLLPSQPQSPFSSALVHTGKLKDDPSRFDHRDVVRYIPLASAHARLGRLHGHQLIGEDTNPKLPAAQDV